LETPLPEGAAVSSFRLYVSVVVAASLVSGGLLLAQEKQVEHSAPAAHEAGHAADAGHAAGHDAHAPHLGAIGVDTSPAAWSTDLAVYTFVVFLLLLLVLWKFAWKPISEGLDRREHAIAENIASAQRSNDDAKKLLAEYERRLNAAQDQVRGILEEARRDAEHTQQEIVAKARADAQAEVQRGRREIETATAQALQQLAETSANMAVGIAGQIVRTQLSPADHARLVEEAMAKFRDGAPSRN
jgi:F-type H+-transporting ATPase subunit b